MGNGVTIQVSIFSLTQLCNGRCWQDLHRKPYEEWDRERRGQMRLIIIIMEVYLGWLCTSTYWINPECSYYNCLHWEWNFEYIIIITAELPSSSIWVMYSLASRSLFSATVSSSSSSSLSSTIFTPFGFLSTLVGGRIHKYFHSIP